MPQTNRAKKANLAVIITVIIYSQQFLGYTIISISVTNSNSFIRICHTILIMELNTKIQFSITYFISPFGRFVIHSLPETLLRKTVQSFLVSPSHFSSVPLQLVRVACYVNWTVKNKVNLEKHYVTKVVPKHLERPLYVFQSSFLLHNVLKNWAPMKEVLFEIPSEFKNGVLGFYTFGWLFLVQLKSPQNLSRLIVS